MLFTDIPFIFIFLPIVLILFWSFKSSNLRLLILLIASYFFYGYWNYKFVPLLLFSTLIDFFSGIMLHKTKSKNKKIFFLLISISCNLGLLGFFKYYNFFTDNLNHALQQLNMSGFFPLLKIVLPVGISFYTFQSMSYTIDIYRGFITPTPNFIKFASYVSLFPQLVAGPIVRYKDVAEQFENINKKFNIHNFTYGFQLFLLGLFKKVLIADHVARYIGFLFENYQSIGFLEAWGAMLGYTFQIYFDFSGYSDMAIGLGLMIGLKFPINFNSPYKALNISDFWRRWHISLSTWLKDYLYIPLGGSRVSNKRTAFNVIFVFTLGGLWHGANWTFVLWGLYQGICIALYNMFKKHWDRLPAFIQRPLTFYIVIIGWVFFRSADLHMASIILKKIMFFSGAPYIKSGLTTLKLGIWALILYFVVNFFPNSNTFKPITKIPHAIAFAFLFLWTILEINSLQLEFLYYQF